MTKPITLIEKRLCPSCHSFFDGKTGEKIPELSHITVINVQEKEICKQCTEERDQWGANGPEAT